MQICKFELYEFTSGFLKNVLLCLINNLTKLLYNESLKPLLELYPTLHHLHANRIRTWQQLHLLHPIIMEVFRVFTLTSKPASPPPHCPAVAHVIASRETASGPSSRAGQ